MAPKQLLSDSDDEDGIIEQEEEEDEIWSHVSNTFDETMEKTVISERCMTPDTQKVYNGYRSFTINLEEKLLSKTKDEPFSRSASSPLFFKIVAVWLVIVAASFVCFIKYRGDMMKEIGALQAIVESKDISIQQHLKHLKEMQNEKIQLIQQLEFKNQMVELNSFQVAGLRILINDTRKLLDEKDTELEEAKILSNQRKRKYEEKVLETETAMKDREESHQAEVSKLLQMLYYSVLCFMSKNTSEYNDDVMNILSNLYYDLDENLNDIISTLKDANLRHIGNPKVGWAASKTGLDYLTIWGCWFLNMLAKNDGVYDSTIIEAGGLSFLSSVIETYSFTHHARYKQEEYVSALVHSNARQAIRILLNQGEISDEMNNISEETRTTEQDSHSDDGHNEYNGSKALVVGWKQPQTQALSILNALGLFDVIHGVISLVTDSTFFFLNGVFDILCRLFV